MDSEESKSHKNRAEGTRNGRPFRLNMPVSTSLMAELIPQI